MTEKLWTLVIVLLWMVCIPLDIGSAIEHYKAGRYYRFGISIMFTVLGFMVIAGQLFCS